MGTGRRGAGGCCCRGRTSNRHRRVTRLTIILDLFTSGRRAARNSKRRMDVVQALVYAFAHPRVLVEEILVRPVEQIAPDEGDLLAPGHRNDWACL